MSTKATIAHGKSFHFYHEVMDNDHVYLELETTQFAAGYGRVMVPIPIHIWETIRHLGAPRLDLVDRTDEDLLATVKSEVDQRIERHRELMRNQPDRAGFLSFSGSLAYGSADKPRDVQIERGMTYYRQEREHQQQIQAAIAALRKNA